MAPLIAPLIAPLFAPVAAGALTVLGLVALSRYVVREWRRVNAELHPPAGAAPERSRLRRDPATGVFRPEEGKRQR
jgi:hypothetical protein